MSGLCMCWVVGGGGSGTGWLPSGGIRASQGTFSSLHVSDLFNITKVCCFSFARVTYILGSSVWFY